ncbi:hypothetical protein RAA17_20995 [Komagataeibacter rhaeticus]|nr:hypothetical protein [Komagataeibacter rhaeticus]
MLPRQLPGGGVGEIRFAPDRVFNPASYPSGGAGMVGTAGNSSPFLKRSGRGEGLLAPASAALFGRNAIGDVDMGPLARGRRFGYGGGHNRSRRRAHATQPRQFYMGVYGHQWVVDRARGISIVMLSNTALAGMAGSYPDAVVAAVYGG